MYINEIEIDRRKAKYRNSIIHQTSRPALRLKKLILRRAKAKAKETIKAHTI